MEINTETLAVMGATLANGGVCPSTGEKVQVQKHIHKNQLPLYVLQYYDIKLYTRSQ